MVAEASDFPHELCPIIHLNQDSQPTNVVLFLPGLGDSSKNFSGFAKALNLPDTLTITLQPPFPLPFPAGPGFHWSDDLQIDTATGSVHLDSPLSRATALVANTVNDVLMRKCGFLPPNIHLFGFGQGGAVALAIGLDSTFCETSLGGIISLAGALPLSAKHTSKTKSGTPVLLLGGSRGSLTTDDGGCVKRIKDQYAFVEHHKWKRADDGMPQGRGEALPMMKFFARTLKSRRGVPEGAVEIR